MKVNKLVIDSTHAKTDLCELGMKYPTDKSPYNTSTWHKHPYTAIYNLLFAPLRYKYINFGEIGILENQSMLCWREYFPNAKLFGYDFDKDRLEKGLTDALSNTVYNFIDITDDESIKYNFSNPYFFDIIVEDSNHLFEDQIRFINIAYKAVKPGGIIIIEDLFHKDDEQRYIDAISDEAKEYFSDITFISAEHELKYSPEWDNDKLMVLHRNAKIF
jgi:SAM-dependent methyltransferase